MALGPDSAIAIAPLSGKTWEWNVPGPLLADSARTESRALGERQHASSAAGVAVMQACPSRKCHLGSVRRYREHLERSVGRFLDSSARADFRSGICKWWKMRQPAPPSAREPGKSTKANPDLLEVPRQDCSSLAKIPRLPLCSAGGNDFMGCSGNPTFSTVRIGGGTWLPVSILFRLRIPWRWGRRPRVRPSRPGRSIPTSAVGSLPPTWGPGDQVVPVRRSCGRSRLLTCPTPIVPCLCPRWTAWIRSGR